jgi:hypothetical protein
LDMSVNPTPPDAQLYEAETSFLQERRRRLQADLEEKDEHLASETTHQDALLEIERESLAIYQREREVLNELLRAPERKVHGLERILGDRLRRADQRVMASARTVGDKGTYDDVYWRAEEERQIIAKILTEWWNWLED